MCFFGLAGLQVRPSRWSIVETVLEYDPAKGGAVSDYRIDVLWDEEATVWVATSEDIPGLVLESGSLDALVERVRFAVSDLLDLNANGGEPVSLSIRSERRELVTV